MTGQITKEIPDDVFMAAIDAFDLSKYPAGTTNTEILALAIMADRASRLSTLPIAGEGKVKALEWGPHPIFGGDDLAVAIIMQWGEHGHKYQAGRDADGPGYKAFLAPTQGSWFWTSPGHASLEDAKAAAQSDYETRILSALISSPGKDGGQEVEAVAVLGYVREAGLRSLAERNHTSVYPLPDEERGYIIPVYAQPASTALVERLTKALEPFANAADRYTNLVLGEDIDHWPCNAGDVTLGHLRAARDTLASEKGGR